jgi:hypothetical protein
MRRKMRVSLRHSNRRVFEIAQKTHVYNGTELTTTRFGYREYVKATAEGEMQESAAPG